MNENPRLSRNYGLAGGYLAWNGAESFVVDLELEIAWMLSEAEYHANWGV